MIGQGFDFERGITPDQRVAATEAMAAYVTARSALTGFNISAIEPSAIETHLSIGLEDSQLVDWVDVGKKDGLQAIITRSDYPGLLKNYTVQIARLRLCVQSTERLVVVLSSTDNTALQVG